MTHVFPCTACGAPTPTKLRKPKRCAPCAKAEALDYSRWNYRAHRDELLAYHRKRYAENRERILAQRVAKRRARESTCSSAAPVDWRRHNAARRASAYSVQFFITTRAPWRSVRRSKWPMGATFVISGSFPRKAIEGFPHRAICPYSIVRTAVII